MNNWCWHSPKLGTKQWVKNWDATPVLVVWTPQAQSNRCPSMKLHIYQNTTWSCMHESWLIISTRKPRFTHEKFCGFQVWASPVQGTCLWCKELVFLYINGSTRVCEEMKNLLPQAWILSNQLLQIHLAHNHNGNFELTHTHGLLQHIYRLV